MAAPLILLYGVSILIVRAVNPHIEDEDEETEEADEDEETAQSNT